MKDSFSAYPELIFVDATYKLLNLGIPTYLVLCEDSNGQSEIVAVCLLVSEDAESIDWMFSVFKKCNDKWKDIRVVMADKDIKERDVIKKYLPQVAVLICLFHTLRTFRREISCEKLGISSGQRVSCLEFVQKMAYASTEAEYEKIYQHFQQAAPKEVLEYFNEGWHSIRDEWVLGLKSAHGSFLNATNNRLESINGKLKQVINYHSTLEDFIDNFFVALRTERDHRAAVQFQKVKVHAFQEGSAELQYSTLLTCYAATYVLKQYELASKVKDLMQCGEFYKVTTSEGEKVVNEKDCGCIFRQSMLLPCRHIFALRKKLKKLLYDPNLCNKRWTISYYKSTQRIFTAALPEASLVLTTSKSKSGRRLSQNDKYRKALVLTTQLASTASEASYVHFHRRLKLLKELADCWRNGEEVDLSAIDNCE